MPAKPMPPLLPPPPAAVGRESAGFARGLARDAFGRELDPPVDTGAAPPPADDSAVPRRETATDAIGRRAGALSDELDFPEFVASLVHGTFDAIVDSAIRQMESFADLVSAVAKPIEQFTQEHVSLNQARDSLVEQYPKDLTLARDESGVHVVPRPMVGEGGDEEMRSPEWLADYGLAGEDLTADIIEEQLVPRARERVARNRLQTLSTMVLLGMNRVVVRDGTIGARLRFRAAAADHTRVDYAVSDDAGEPPATQWGRRGSRSYAAPRTKVSTVGVNVQSDSELKAELFGDVKINFASETVPLDRFIDEARRNVLERHARPASAGRETEVSRKPAPGAPSAEAPANAGVAGPPSTSPSAATPLAPTTHPAQPPGPPIPGGAR